MARLFLSLCLCCSVVLAFVRRTLAGFLESLYLSGPLRSDRPTHRNLFHSSSSIKGSKERQKAGTWISSSPRRSRRSWRWRGAACPGARPHWPWWRTCRSRPPAAPLSARRRRRSAPQIERPSMSLGYTTLETQLALTSTRICTRILPDMQTVACTWTSLCYLLRHMKAGRCADSGCGRGNSGGSTLSTRSIPIFMVAVDEGHVPQAPCSTAEHTSALHPLCYHRTVLHIGGCPPQSSPCQCRSPAHEDRVKEDE